MKIHGNCHCEAIKFEADIDENKVVICHCQDCQKLSASVFRTVAITSANNFHLKAGTVKEYVKTAESGNARAQGFCENCGSQIYATSAAHVTPLEDRMYAIRLGVVDERATLKPVMEIWTDEKLTWLPDLGTKIQFPHQPE